MKTLKFFDNSVDLYVIEYGDFIKPDSVNLSRIVSLLSYSEQTKYNKFSNINAKYTFLTARYYLRQILSQKLSIEPDKINIEISKTGKPYQSHCSNLFFNISHTKNLIIIGFATLPIGVDVEKCERNVDRDSILKHFFSELEKESYFSQPEKDRQLAFYKGWTRKESILKAFGDGLSKMNKNEVSFKNNTDNPVISSDYPVSFKIKDFIPSEGYVACLAVLESN